MLTDVTIEGLRGVGRVELSFAPEQRAYVLFGANGVGKTKCLEALYQFLLASNKEFAQDRWAEHGQNLAVSSKKIVMARMSANGVTFEIPKESADVEDLFILSMAWRTEGTAWHSYPVVFLGAARRASLTEREESSTSALGTFKDRRKTYFGKLQQALLQSGDLRSLGMQGSTHGWFVKRARSSNPYEESKDNRKAEIDTVLSVLHAIDSRIDAEFLTIDGSDHVFLKVDGEKRELGELSSGFAALLKLIQAIVAGYAAFTNEKQLRNVRGIVLIDEIDAHLHVEWQVKIIPCLKSLFPNTTFYVATHSPLVLVQLKDGEAYLLKREEDEVVRGQMIEGANRRIFDDVLEGAMGVDLNKLKAMSRDREQSQKAKQNLLSLLHEVEAAK
jgi:predicted ATP-binding protein involved in virulence